MQVVAQRVLGHASPEMTAKVYTHLGLEDLRGAVEGVSEPRHGREAVGYSASGRARGLTLS